MNKKILIGIDFSDCSLNALEHAITIAQRSSSGITMVWVNHLDYSKEIFSVEPKDLLNEVEEKFKEIIKKYKSKLGREELNYQIRKGKVYKEICAVADEIDAFLIVIGTHGSTGFEEFWIGSNANRVVSTSRKPIITIRAGVNIDKGLRKIVIPFDSTKVTRQKLPMTALLAKFFNAEVHILGMYTSKLDDIRYRIRNYVEQAKDYLKENDILYKEEFIETDHITEATNEYANKINANLISIMTEQETKTSNLWLGPYASQMVNHSPVPVLSIHPDRIRFYNG